MRILNLLRQQPKCEQRRNCKILFGRTYWNLLLCWLPWRSNQNGSSSDSECGLCLSPFPIANCKLKTVYSKLSIANFQLLITNCQLQIANCKLPISKCYLQIANCDYKLPIAITNCQLQIANCKLQIANYQMQIANCKRPIANCQLAIGNSQLQISYLLSQQPNVNREQTVRFTWLGLNKIQCFVDCHGDPTTMGFYLILNHIRAVLDIASKTHRSRPF